MTKIIGVRFKPVGKMYYFDPLGFDIKKGDSVIVETSRGIEYGEVVRGVMDVSDNSVVKPLKGVLRMATDEDVKRHIENKEKEKEAYKICVEKISEHGLEMKLIEVEYAFDRNKILFYFTADGRVDFRELVKDLAAVFRTRIELRQIGVRDESKTRGSIGICGRSLCCSQFLDEFVPVSIKMAKEQGLSLNPSKISGTCGRLMCCLKYEQDTYEALIEASPKAGAKVMTPDGEGTVVSVALLRGKVRVRFGSDDDMTQKDYDVSEINAGAGNAVKSAVPDEDDMYDETEPEKIHEEPEKPEKKREAGGERDKRKPRGGRQQGNRQKTGPAEKDGSAERIRGRKSFKGRPKGSKTEQR